MESINNDYKMPKNKSSKRLLYKENDQTLLNIKRQTKNWGKYKGAGKKHLYTKEVTSFSMDLLIQAEEFQEILIGIFDGI